MKIKLLELHRPEVMICIEEMHQYLAVSDKEE